MNIEFYYQAYLIRQSKKFRELEIDLSFKIDFE